MTFIHLNVKCHNDNDLVGGQHEHVEYPTDEDDRISLLKKIIKIQILVTLMSYNYTTSNCQSK